jgi:hypothetical protein
MLKSERGNNSTLKLAIISRPVFTDPVQGAHSLAHAGGSLNGDYPGFGDDATQVAEFWGVSNRNPCQLDSVTAWPRLPARRTGGHLSLIGIVKVHPFGLLDGYVLTYGTADAFEAI